MLIFYIIHPVSHGKTLGLHFIIASVGLTLLGYSRIHQQLPAVRKREGTPRKTPVPVIDFIGCQRRRQILPVQQILTHRMSPMHGPPEGIIRMILIEHMIFSIIPGKSVWIIHPSDAGRQMEIRPLFLRNSLSKSFLVFTSLPQCLTCHINFHDPFLFFSYFSMFVLFLKAILSIFIYLEVILTGD